jgi:hypothetical protein
MAYIVTYPNASQKIFTGYAIIGDDCFIKDIKVANVYVKLMRDLGLEISVTKTIQEKYIAEFAKTLYFKGVSYKSIPIYLSLRAKSPLTNLLSLVAEVHSHGIRFNLD